MPVKTRSRGSTNNSVSKDALKKSQVRLNDRVGSKVWVSKNLGEFSIGHRLMHHAGKCSSLHGHNYGVTVYLYGQPNDSGMVVDFSEMKKFKDLIEPFDHKTVLYREDPLAKMIPEEHLFVVDYHPTVENLAYFWLDHMREVIHVSGKRFHSAERIKLVVSETANSFAEVESVLLRK